MSCKLKEIFIFALMCLSIIVAVILGVFVYHFMPIMNSRTKIKITDDRKRECDCPKYQDRSGSLYLSGGMDSYIRRKKSVPGDDFEAFSYLTSLSILDGNGGPWTKRFICTCSIVSKFYILTGKLSLSNKQKLTFENVIAKMRSTFEKVLCILTFFLLFVGLILGICVFLVLPKYFSQSKGYIQDRTQDCKCWEILGYVDENGEPVEGGGEKKSAYIGGNQPKMYKYNTNNLKVDKLRENLEYCVPLPKFAVVIEDDESFNRIEDFPHLVSITSLAYSDDRRDRRFVCTASVVSNFWVFTAAGCLKNVDSLDQLEVRSSSPFWSKGGLTHKVSKQTEPFNGIVGLKVNPYFRFTRYLRKIDVLLTNKKYVYETALTIGWDKATQRYAYQSKDATFAVKKWTTYPCEDGMCRVAEVNNTMKCDGIPTGKPLVPNCPVLAAIQVGTSCGNEEKDKFIDMQTEEMQNWAYSVLGADRNKRMEVTNASKLKTLYSQMTDDTYLETCTAEILQVPAIYSTTDAYEEDSLSSTSTTSRWRDDSEDYDSRFDIGELKVGRQPKMGHKHGIMIRRQNIKESTASSEEIVTKSDDTTEVPMRNSILIQSRQKRDVKKPTSTQKPIGETSRKTTQSTKVVPLEKSSQISTRKRERPDDDFKNRDRPNKDKNPKPKWKNFDTDYYDKKFDIGE